VRRNQPVRLAGDAPKSSDRAKDDPCREINHLYSSPVEEPGLSTTAAKPTPSQRARALLRGAYDTHIHVAPDVVPRIVDDFTLGRRFAELGMDGFVLKSHYGSTAERAAVVRAAVPGVQALGGSF
jgi:hypothetical protein